MRLSPLHRLMGCALALGLSLSPARAQEEPEPPQYVYALDDQTELTLTFRPKDQKSWGAELRLYGEPAQGQIFSFSGDLRLLTKNVYEYKNGTPPTQKEVRVAGQPGEKSPLEVLTRNFTATTPRSRCTSTGRSSRSTTQRARRG